MTQRTKITIFNAALTRCGETPIAEGDGSAVGIALDANYPEIVRTAFEQQEYPFGKTRVSLTSRASGRFGFDDAYVYPEEIIHIVDVFLNKVRAVDLIEAWEIDASTRELMINSAARSVEIEGIKIGLEYTWSGEFTMAIQRRLEAVIKDVLEEAEESSAKDSEADYRFLKAGVKGSKGRSKRRFRDGGRLTRAHASGRAR